MNGIKEMEDSLPVVLKRLQLALDEGMIVLSTAERRLLAVLQTKKLETAVYRDDELRAHEYLEAMQKLFSFASRFIRTRPMTAWFSRPDTQALLQRLP